MNEKGIRAVLVEACAEVDRRKRQHAGVGAAALAPAVIAAGLLAPPCALYGDCAGGGTQADVQLCYAFEAADVTASAPCSRLEDDLDVGECRYLRFAIDGEADDVCAFTAELPDGTRRTEHVELREGQCGTIASRQVRFE